MSLSSHVALIETPCRHCGLPAYGVPAGELAFCCRGCRGAYALLRDEGLLAYYDVRARVRDEGDQVAQNVVEGDEAYVELDDPGYLEAHGFTPGRVCLHVSGVHCAACVWLFEQLPAVMPGVTSARLDLGSHRLRLAWDPSVVRLSKVARFVRKLGYAVHPADEARADRDREEGHKELIRLGVAGACAGNTMLVAFALYAGDAATMSPAFVSFFEWTSALLALPSVTYGAMPFHRGALAGLRVRRLHMDLPISLGIAAGFLGSLISTVRGDHAIYFDSVTTLVFLLLIGRYVLRRGQSHSASQAALLHLLLPGSATRITSKGVEQVATRLLRPGDRVRVEAGARLPADGRLESKEGHFDLSTLTGESRLVRIERGGRVLGGTKTEGGRVEFVVERVGEQTRMGHLVERLESSEHARVPLVERTDRVSAVFVAAVLVLSCVGAVAWWVLEPERIFQVVVSLLVVSCPCALGLATPSALAMARARAVSAGFLLRSAAVLERLAKAKRVVLDKTGTLTYGHMRVAWAEGWDDALARAVSALESESTHPVGRALEAFAQRRQALAEGSLDPQAGGASAACVVTEVQREPAGRGLEAMYAGSRLRVGASTWLAPSGPQAAIFQRAIDRALEEGLTPVLVEHAGEVRAVIAVGDIVRPEAKATVATLVGLGLEVEIESGDHPAIVRRIAAELGIASAHGGLSPEDKARRTSGSEDTVMVGDGVNDTLAFRAASVGVALGGGAEAALEVADVHLAEGGLAALPDLLVGARAAISVVRRNLAFALVYNAVFASLALAGQISPLVAAVLMPASSLTVLLSSLRSPTFRSPTFRSQGRDPVGVPAAEPRQLPL